MCWCTQSLFDIEGPSFITMQVFISAFRNISWLLCFWIRKPQQAERPTLTVTFWAETQTNNKPRILNTEFGLLKPQYILIKNKGHRELHERHSSLFLQAEADQTSYSNLWVFQWIFSENKEQKRKLKRNTPSTPQMLNKNTFRHWRWGDTKCILFPSLSTVSACRENFTFFW